MSLNITINPDFESQFFFPEKSIEREVYLFHNKKYIIVL